MPPPKRLCARWLDELIMALWADLQAQVVWTLEREQEEEEAVAAAGAAAPGGGGGGQTAPPPPPPATTNHPLNALGWLRRGMLAERLGRPLEALPAYARAASQPAPASSSSSSSSPSSSAATAAVVVASAALCRLRAACGDVPGTVGAAAVVARWGQARMLEGRPGAASAVAAAARRGGAHARAALPPAPTAVSAGIADAIAASRRGGGLDAARVAVADLGLDGGAAGFWLRSAVEAASDGQ
jgi:hypothetical protein